VNDFLSIALVAPVVLVALAAPVEGRLAGQSTVAPAAAFHPCGDTNGDGSFSASDALLVLRAAVGTQNGCIAMVCDATGGHDGVKASDALLLLRVAVGSASASDLRCPSAARIWNEELLDAIRRDIPRPTVHARNLFHLSIAMWDAWVAYDDETSAEAYLFHEKPPIDPDVYSARSIAISYASYRILGHRFAASPGASASLLSFDAAMDELGLDRDFTATDGDSPAAVGNRIAAAVLAYGATDGSNEGANYSAPDYMSVNEPLFPARSGTEMVDPNRWQPLSLKYMISQNGIPIPLTQQAFICPHWAAVAAFALESVDPGPPPQLGGEGDAEYKSQAVEVIRLSAELDPDDGELIDISPAAMGNNPLGTDDGTGYGLNPYTGEPYAAQIVKRGDWARVLTEFWADGPLSETPPGHWNVIANEVADSRLFEKRLGGTGDELDNLQWDVKVYLALNGAVHDAAVSAWGLKGFYDSARPISMVRYMAGLGQSSDELALSFHVNGLPLEDGLVEVVTAQSAAPAQRHAHLAAHIGKIAIRSWLGNSADPETENAGAGWILGVNWLPYQRDTFVTPAFAGYVSGHSTFSRAAAEVMTLVTGNAYFPGGLLEFRADAGAYLETEHGPSANVTLQSATYQDAADSAGLSRLYGGIHIRADDFAGRTLGYQIGRDAAALAGEYWNGTAGD
jgi:hypothetical protein